MTANYTRVVAAVFSRHICHRTVTHSSLYVFSLLTVAGARHKSTPTLTLDLSVGHRLTRRNVYDKMHNITRQWRNYRVFDAMETEAEERAPPLPKSRNEATKIAKGCYNRLLFVCSANFINITSVNVRHK